MLSTANEIFLSFLDGIRKSHTTTVKPEKFARIWNEWAMPEWINSNTSLREGVELSQKQIDDLSNIRKIYIMEPVTWSPKGQNTAFRKPYDGETATIIDELSGAPITGAPVNYLRALNVMFRLDYDSRSGWDSYNETYHGGQECGLTGESDWFNAGWLRSTYLKSNVESIVMSSPYRKPKDSRLYHRIVGNYIQMISDPWIGNAATKMRLDFLYYPSEMTYTTQLGLLYDDREFWPYQITEIIQIAVRLYLERTQSPRWQSFFQEDIAKRVDKI